MGSDIGHDHTGVLTPKGYLNENYWVSPRNLRYSHYSRPTQLPELANPPFEIDPYPTGSARLMIRRDSWDIYVENEILGLAWTMMASGL